MSENEFYEEVPVEVRLGRAVKSGEVNRALRTLGFRLCYDVYALPRPEGHPHWQSEVVAEVEMLESGDEVDAQEACDTIRIVYPLATVPSSMIDRFLDAVMSVRDGLGGTLWYNDAPTTIPALSDHLTGCVTSLMTTWGEEPGSKDLRVMILNSHG